jgi:hypothetical protein
LLGEKPLFIEEKKFPAGYKLNKPLKST